MHSRRTVPTNRSANAFARGDRTGVLMTLIPSVRSTSSKLFVNLASLSRMRNLAARERPARSEAQVPGLLGDPLPHRIGGDAGEIDPTGVEIDEKQHVEATEQHRVDGEEVTGQHGLCLGSQEVRPGRARSTRRGVDAMPAQDLPNTRRGELNPTRCQLPVDPSVAPGRVLCGQAEDQRDRASGNSRSSRPSLRVGPLPSH